MRDLPKASTSAAPRGIPMDRPRRRRDQDRRAPGDHRPGEADLRQGRGDTDVLRRPARREGRGRRDRRRRDAVATAATQDVFIEHVGIPTSPAVRLAVDALQELGMHRRVQLIVSRRDPHGRRRGQGARARRGRGLDRHGGARGHGGQRAGARRRLPSDRSASGYYDDGQAGRDPVGISTQEDEPLPASIRSSAAENRQLPPRAHAGDADPRAPAGSPTSTTSSRKTSSR